MEHQFWNFDHFFVLHYRATLCIMFCLILFSIFPKYASDRYTYKQLVLLIHSGFIGILYLTIDLLCLQLNFVVDTTKYEDILLTV